MTRDDVVKTIAAEARKAGSQKALADRWRISPGYLNDVLQGHRGPSTKILDRMGLEEIVSYKRVRMAE